MTDTRLFLRATGAMALVAALTACGGGSSDLERRADTAEAAEKAAQEAQATAHAEARAAEMAATEAEEARVAAVEAAAEADRMAKEARDAAEKAREDASKSAAEKAEADRMAKEAQEDADAAKMAATEAEKARVAAEAKLMRFNAQIDLSTMIDGALVRAKASDKTAEKAMMGLNFETAMGRSVTVERNAGAILNAKMVVDGQLSEAQMAVDKLEKLRDDAAPGAEEVSAKALLKAAKADLMQIKELLKEGSVLRNAVDIVEVYTDPAKKKDAAYHADKAAKAVWDALDEKPSYLLPNIEGLKGNPVFAMGDNRPSSAMTFDQIFSDSVKKTVGNKDYSAVSLEGMKSTKAITDVGGLRSGALASYEYKHKGIDGSVVCRDECVNAKNGITEGDEFGKGWYFVPVIFMGATAQEAMNNSGKYYVKNGDDYKLAQFIQYGMWLRDGDNGPILARRMGAGDGTSATTFKLNSGDSNSATYSGDAKGLSAVRRYNPDGTFKTVSGQFTADVELEAGFGPTAELRGTVSGFEPVSDVDNHAVDRGWEITLGKAEINDTGAVNGVTSSSGSSFSGSWTAQPFGFGDMTERPSGFHGGFHHKFRADANVDTGRVSGLYIADKDE